MGERGEEGMGGTTVEGVEGIWYLRARIAVGQHHAEVFGGGGRRGSIPPRRIKIYGAGGREDGFTARPA